MIDRDIKGISRIIVHIESILDYMKGINSREVFNNLIKKSPSSIGSGMN